MKSSYILAAGTAALLLTSASAFACDICDSSDHHAHRRNPHAPIGIMGDHMHKQGEVMFSYRYKHMRMDGMQDGTDSLTPLDVIGYSNPNAPPANFRLVPTDMTMDMHMFGTMIGVTDWLTVTGMLPYVQKDMDVLTYNMAGTNIGSFSTRTEGFGDVKLTGLVRIHEDATHHVHLNAGLSLPTGSIAQKDVVLMPSGMSGLMRMPYGMQLGTGTYDLLPGITYTGITRNWNWGAQYQAKFRLEDKNSEGYGWGDKHTLNGWAGYQWTSWLNTNARLSFESSEAISGRDSRITGAAPGADPDNYGGETLEAGLGFNITPKQWPYNQYFSLEATTPLYQDLNGPQMKRDVAVTAGYTISF
ncbi:MAG: transporter [Rhodospirillales bacterium]|nr:transporter [Rhodospirillales bacterium]MCB9980218.1 transporter [Rhodospirillales bacterium]